METDEAATTSSKSVVRGRDSINDAEVNAVNNKMAFISSPGGDSDFDLEEKFALPPGKY
jgi:3-phosphoglycerate kinase